MAARRLGINVVLSRTHSASEVDEHVLGAQLAELKASGVHAFFLNTLVPKAAVVNAANAQGMLGPDYVWFILDGYSSLNSQDDGIRARKLMRGWLSVVPKARIGSAYDAFLARYTPYLNAHPNPDPWFSAHDAHSEFRLQSFSFVRLPFSLRC